MKVKRTTTIKTESYQVGDVISFKLKTGEKVKAMAVDQDTEGTTFLFVACLGKEYPMNLIGTVEGGYDASELRKTLNSDILKTFPGKIRELMLPVYEDDLLTIPCRADIFGEESWEPMKKRRNRMAFRGRKEELEWYWNRDVVSSTYFAYVTSIGLSYATYASYVYGVRPAFRIRNL
ncbi:MAG: hypothetical protein LUI87_02120 [Lachnospiraceae bacterium]|nr:hypothetical protein [Lachnospiraceae bacterium]